MPRQILEEAKSEQHTRDMELMRESAKSEREDKIFEKVSIMVPYIINRLAGQKVFNAEDPGAMMLKSFAESLTQEQFQKIQGTLNQEQMLTLGQLLTSTQQTQKKLTNGSS